MAEKFLDVVYIHSFLHQDARIGIGGGSLPAGSFAVTFQEPSLFIPPTGILKSPGPEGTDSPETLGGLPGLLPRSSASASLFPAAASVVTGSSWLLPVPSDSLRGGIPPSVLFPSGPGTPVTLSPLP